MMNYKKQKMINVPAEKVEVESAKIEAKKSFKEIVKGLAFIKS